MKNVDAFNERKELLHRPCDLRVRDTLCGTLATPVGKQLSSSFDRKLQSLSFAVNAQIGSPLSHRSDSVSNVHARAQGRKRQGEPDWGQHSRLNLPFSLLIRSSGMRRFLLSRWVADFCPSVPEKFFGFLRLPLYVSINLLALLNGNEGLFTS